MQLFALFALVSFTLTHAAPLAVTVPGLTKAVDIKVPALPIAVPVIGGASIQANVAGTSVTTPKTGTGSGVTTPVSPPDLLNQLNQYVAALRPAKTVQEAVEMIKKIQAQVELAVLTTVGALKTNGTKYPQSINPAAYLLRTLERYVASLPVIVAGDTQFKGAAADLDKALNSLFKTTMDSASSVQVLNALLQAGLNMPLLTGSIFKQTATFLLGGK